MAKLFLSHSSNDKAFVRKLARDLERNGQQCWLDEWEIKVGESIIQKLEQGIEDSDYVLLILSKSSLSSKWVEKEWRAKFWDQVNNDKTRVLPCLLEVCDIPTLLKGIKYANFVGSYRHGLSELLEAINSTTPGKVGATIGRTPRHPPDALRRSRVARTVRGASAAPPVVLPGTYSTYRRMLHDPAIELGRACLIEAIAQRKWRISYSRAITSAARSALQENLAGLVPQFIKESMTALDFGWCGYEVIWEVRDGYYYVERLKWLNPETTVILTDTHGGFSGLRARGVDLGTAQSLVDLDEQKSLLVTIRDARSFPADLHGSSRLELVRELWSKMGPSHRFRQTIYDAYVGVRDSPHWFTLAVQPVLDGLQTSLNGLLLRLVAINYGASIHKWVRISF